MQFLDKMRLLHDKMTQYNWYYWVISRFTFVEIIFVIGVILWVLGV